MRTIKQFVGFVDGKCQCYHCHKEKKVIRVIFPGDSEEVDMFQICPQCFKNLSKKITKLIEA